MEIVLLGRAFSFSLSPTTQSPQIRSKRDYVNAGKLKELRDSVADMAVQISKLESKGNTDISVIKEDLALLNTPRVDQLSQIESQVSSKGDARRRLIKEKLTQLE